MPRAGNIWKLEKLRAMGFAGWMPLVLSKKPSHHNPPPSDGNLSKVAKQRPAHDNTD